LLDESNLEKMPDPMYFTELGKIASTIFVSENP
jgi:hypothetical protein